MGTVSYMLDDEQVTLSNQRIDSWINNVEDDIDIIDTLPHQTIWQWLLGLIQ